MSWNMIAVLAQEPPHGLTWHRILSNIPHDPTAFVVYVLVIASVWAVVHYGRKSAEQTGKEGGSG